MFGFHTFGKRMMQIGARNFISTNHYSFTRSLALSNMETTSLMSRTSPVPNLTLMNIMNLRQLMEKSMEQSELQINSSILLSDIVVQGVSMRSLINNIRNKIGPKQCMTLQIKVAKISGKSSNGDLLLSGRNTGTFRVSASYQPNDERRIVYFSIDDCIQLSLYEKNIIPDSLNRKAFLNQPCQLIKQFISKNDDEWNKYDIQLYTSSDEPYAIVHLQIQYERGLLLQGIIPNIIQRKFRNFQFYKGGHVGKTKNIFNFLDFCCQPQSPNFQFKAMQTAYEDTLE